MLLGLHTYSLYHHGVGQAWADFKLPWPRQLTTFQILDLAASLGLDGLHLDDGALESLDRPFLEETTAAAREMNLYLEYNFSLDLGGGGIGLQHDLFEAMETALAVGADIVKMSLDLKRPHPVTGSRFHPAVMEIIKGVIPMLKKAGPIAERNQLRIAVENHCDTFSQEILWLLDQVDHPAVGACIDTANAAMVLEDPMEAIENLAPRAFTNHFRDDRIEFRRNGYRLIGTANGEGDIDLKKALAVFREKSTMRRINIETEMAFPLDDKDVALALELETIQRSIRYCRAELGIIREKEDG